jgi:hypothetical protein
MTKRGLELLVKAIAAPVRSLRDVLTARLDAIDAHLGIDTKTAALMAHAQRAPSHTSPVTFQQIDPASLKPKVVHRGTWDADRIYSDGDGVLFEGGAFRAVSATKGCRPGTAAAAWERLT